MKKIFHLFREKRKSLGVSLDRAAKKTGIPDRFLLAIEKGRCKSIPRGYLNIYIRHYANFLGIDEGRALALFRRDCNIDDLRHKRKTDSFWRRPVFPFLTGLNRRDLLSVLDLSSWQAIFFSLVIFISFAYLGFQYYRFNAAPKIRLLPVPQRVSREHFLLKGRVDPSVALKVDDRVVFVKGDGSFTADITLMEGENIIAIEARSPAGKKTVLEKRIVFSKESN